MVVYLGNTEQSMKEISKILRVEEATMEIRCGISQGLVATETHTDSKEPLESARRSVLIRLGNSILGFLFRQMERFPNQLDALSLILEVLGFELTFIVNPGTVSLTVDGNIIETLHGENQEEIKAKLCKNTVQKIVAVLYPELAHSFSS